MRVYPLAPFLLVAAVFILLLPGRSTAANPGDTDIAAAFHARRARVLHEVIKGVNPRDSTKGGMLDIAACYSQGVNLEWANARLAAVDAAPPPPGVNMFWMYPMVTVMECGQNAMSAANRIRIREMWRQYFPYRGDTENHWVLYYSSLYLAAQANPDAAGGQWYNGKSSAENMAEARGYLENWMRITTSFGQGEFDSPNYLEEYAAPLALLSGFAADPRFKAEAHLLLDYIFYGYAVQQLNGEYGGAHSRVYPRQAVQPGNTPAAAIGWLLFGLGDYQANGTIVILAMSGYEPPPILWEVAHARSQPYVERELKRTRWRMRHAGPQAFLIGGKSTVPVYKYTYMDPDFVIGSCQGGLLQPIQQQTWSLIWQTDHPINANNCFFGVQPSSSPEEGTMYFASPWDTVTDSITRSKADYDSPDKLEGGSPYEQVAQQGPALIALYDIPPEARFPLVDTIFPRDLTGSEEDPSGWIFSKGGKAYIAYRPLAKGRWKPMDWTGLLKGGAGGWFSAGAVSWLKGNRCLVSELPKNGYVVQVAPVRNFACFETFKAAVRALPLELRLEPVPEVTFTTLAGECMHARYGESPTVNGGRPNYPEWPLFDGPFGHADRGSRQLDIHFGQRHYRLDFNTATVSQTLGTP